MKKFKWVEGDKIQIEWLDHVELDHRTTDKDVKYPPVVLVTMGVYTRSDKMHRMVAHHTCPSDRECDDEMKILRRCIKKVQPAYSLDDIKKLLMKFDIEFSCSEGFEMYYFILKHRQLANNWKKERSEWKKEMESLENQDSQKV